MRRAELDLGWKTIPGYRHQLEGRENEDAVFVSQEHPFFDAVMIVADGVGGHSEPKRAAETAAEAAAEHLFTERDWTALLGDRSETLRMLQETLRRANAAVLRLASLAGGGKPPGSTLTAAVVADGHLYVAHAGDGSALLMRDGRLQPLVGGEERREGNRPQSFLGMAPQMEIEESLVALREGDRILLCTDGLTRYFGAVTEPQPVGRPGAPGAAGAGRSLSEVLGRPNAEAQAIANQLTAHSRTEQYDDDTTVVVAQVHGMRTVPDPRPLAPPSVSQAAGTRSSAAAPPTSGRLPSWTGVAAAVLLAAGLGFTAGRWLASAKGRPPAARQSRGTASLAVEPVVGMPKEPLVLFDTENARVYALQPWPQRDAPRETRLKLLGARMLPSGDLAEAGSWNLDLRRGRLTGPGGRSYFVDVEGDRGLITLRHPGRLGVVARPRAAEVFIDDVSVGMAPQTTLVPAGSHRLRLVWRDGRSREQRVEVPPRGRIAVELQP